MKKKSLSRSSFLKKSLLAVTGLPFVLQTPGCGQATGGGQATSGDKNLPPGGDCGPTDAAIAGPFYVSNAVQATNINYLNMPGTPMRISGTVLGGPDGKLPLPNARVEIWHCDDKGLYHPQASGDVTDYMSAEVNLRGLGVTNQQGQYAFDSIVPGVYPGRRRHLHFRIVANGHRSLITQSYWLDEKGSAREKQDRTDRNTEDCRYIDFKADAKGVMAGVFDIVLEKA
jgi:protocatechuate 3,4-dioxygenase beta subunit